MMDADLSNLYQELIVDHSRRRRNFRALDNPTHKATGYNPLCGDRITVFLDVTDGTVREVTFQGDGCAISMASASLMTEATRGRTTSEIEALVSAFHEFVLTGRETRGVNLGKLAVFSRLREFPVRVKCATLAWHTLRAALAQDPATVSTESSSTS